MMQENITDVALELVDHVRAARAAGKRSSKDLEGAIARLLVADGSANEDALALLSYARLFLAVSLKERPESEEVGLFDTAFRFVHKAVTILEETTGRKTDEFI